MITCARAAYWLQLYVDGRLQERHLAPLEAHLLGCDACRQELATLDSICSALHSLPLEQEPADLTNRILARVAAYEERRAATRAADFGVRWADTLLAALLASISTVLFIALDPALRRTVPEAVAHAFPGLIVLMQAPGPGSVPLVAWVVWITTGTLLALWFAGSEARSSWRRSISARMPRVNVPQLRQP
jgi:anti-sigma factor RsiW